MMGQNAFMTHKNLLSSKRGLKLRKGIEWSIYMDHDTTSSEDKNVCNYVELEEYDEDQLDAESQI